MYNRNMRYWLFQAAGWGTFALINIFFAFSFDKLNDKESVNIFIGRLGFFLLLGIVFTHLMRLIIIRLGILQKTLEKQILQFFVITACLVLVVSYINLELLSRFNLLSKGEKEILFRAEKAFWINKFVLVLNTAFYFFIYFIIWNLIYFVYHYVEKSRKQQVNTLQLESLVKELELKTIKAHINPHFIFNSLNSIRALIDENPSRARTAITELSNILRSSMKTEKQETVSFEKELAIVKDYLALENMRFEDRLKIEYEIDEDTLDQQVPPMMLQTLVENAIKHGISKQIGGGVVKVISDFKGDYHEMAVQNTGKLNGFANKDGFGLASTQDRLNLLFGDKAKFEIKQLDTAMVEAKVSMPVTMP
jgi:two-component system, LytTR family, sensor kinase